MREWSYSSTHSSHRHLMEVNGLVPLWLSRIGGRVGPRADLDAVTKRDIPALAQNLTPALQLIASHSTELSRQITL
jgi:hypothetical protein